MILCIQRCRIQYYIYSDAISIEEGVHSQMIQKLSVYKIKSRKCTLTRTIQLVRTKGRKTILCVLTDIIKQQEI